MAFPKLHPAKADEFWTLYRRMVNAMGGVNEVAEKLGERPGTWDKRLTPTEANHHNDVLNHFLRVVKAAPETHQRALFGWLLSEINCAPPISIRAAEASETELILLGKVVELMGKLSGALIEAKSPDSELGTDISIGEFEGIKGRVANVLTSLEELLGAVGSQVKLVRKAG